MTHGNIDWDDAFEEAGRIAAQTDTAQARARRAAKAKAEHDKGVRLGWWNESGESLLPPDEDDEGDE